MKTHLTLLLLNICVALIQCGPSVPLQSYGEIRYNYYSYADMYAQHGGSIIETGFMALYTDMQNYKLFINSSAYDSIAPTANSVLNSSLLYQNTAPTYQVSNHQCYSAGNAYGDFYWWIEYADFVENLPCPFYQKTSTCSLYTYTYDVTKYTIILTSNNYIQQLNITDYFEDGDYEVEVGYLQMDYHSFQSSIPGNPFVPQEVCYTDQSNTYFCPEAPKITQTIYYLHDYDDTSFGPNVADLLGIAADLCWRSSLGDDKILTQSVVEMDSTWGQYSVCYSMTDCDGGNTKSVGRSCPYGFLYLQGQCANLTSYGQWFSLRNEARCPLLSPVGEGCSWHFYKNVKSISFQCIINQGLFDACYQDGQIPFTNAVGIIDRAFQYCPSVNLPEPQEKEIKMAPRHSTRSADGISQPVRVLRKIHNL